MPKVDTKYNAACNEICARIQARNHTLMSFFYLTALILGVAVRGEGFAIVGVGIPYAALVMVIISNYHEQMIRRLMQFQLELAKTDKEDVGIEWVSDKFYDKTASIRIGRDIAQLVLVIVGSVVPILLVWDRWQVYQEQYRQSYRLAIWGAIVCLSVAVIMILKNIQMKRRPFA